MKPFIAANASPAELEARRKMITKGMRLTVDAPPAAAARFDKATGSFTAEQRDYGIDEIVRRLRLVKQQLDASTQTIRKQR